MNILETILNFITTLARVIFPRRKQPVAGDNLCPCPLPEPPIPTLPVEGGYGNDSRRSGSDTLAALGAILSPLWERYSRSSLPAPRSRLARPLRLHPDALRRNRQPLQSLPHIKAPSASTAGSHKNRLYNKVPFMRSRTEHWNKYFLI